MTTTKTLPKNIKNFLKFLNSNEGSDKSQFFDNVGEPDIFKAREYAQKLREIHKDYLDYIDISQNYNTVTIKIKP